jgi:hypothetical protein
MTSIDPVIAVPMNFKTDAEVLELLPLAEFQKETGSKPEPQARLQVSKGTLPAELSVMVLDPRS